MGKLKYEGILEATRPKRGIVCWYQINYMGVKYAAEMGGGKQIFHGFVIMGDCRI